MKTKLKVVKIIWVKSKQTFINGEKGFHHKINKFGSLFINISSVSKDFQTKDSLHHKLPDITSSLTIFSLAFTTPHFQIILSAWNCIRYSFSYLLIVNSFRTITWWQPHQILRHHFRTSDVEQYEWRNCLWNFCLVLIWSIIHTYE